jgi:putative restriction endonuclease
MTKRRPDGPVIDQFDALNAWSRGGERAPHKPLLVLHALGRWSRGETGDIPFKQVDADLTGLLKEFGPPRPVPGVDRGTVGSPSY